MQPPLIAVIGFLVRLGLHDRRLSCVAVRDESFRRFLTARRLSFGRPVGRLLTPATCSAHEMQIGGLAVPYGKTTHSGQNSWPHWPQTNSANAMGCFTHE